MQRIVPKSFFRSLTTSTTSKMSATTFYDLKAELPSGEHYDFKQLEGKVALIFNSASRCGYTQQLDGLEALNKKYKDQGLVVLGFPCNQFGGQEPGTDATIAAFCTKSYGVSFPIMKKSDVNGAGANSVFKFLKGPKGSNIGWNFEKFLVDKHGKVQRFDSGKTPAALGSEIEKLLA